MSPPVIVNTVSKETLQRSTPRIPAGGSEQQGVFRHSLQAKIDRSPPVEEANRPNLVQSKSLNAVPASAQAEAADASLTNIIQKAAKTYGLEPNLITAIIQAQSNFNPNAVSPAGAQGLMQLMPDTAADLGVRNSFDPEQNIMGASRYLKSLVDRYDGDMGRALKAYTWGMGNVDRNPATPPPEVEQFVARVSAAASQNIEIPQLSTRARLEELSAMTFPAVPAQAAKLDYIHLKARKSGYEGIIHHAAKTYDLSPQLIKAVIHAESDFDNSVVSHAGAQGLMQLMPETAADLGVSNPFDPKENIMGGSRYLKQLVSRYNGDLPLALAAYNWGMGNLERHPGRLPSETSNYVAKILALIPNEMKHETEVQAANASHHTSPSTMNPQTVGANIAQAARAYSRGPV